MGVRSSEIHWSGAYVVHEEKLLYCGSNGSDKVYVCRLSKGPALTTSTGWAVDTLWGKREQFIKQGLAGLQRKEVVASTSAESARGLFNEAVDRKAEGPWSAGRWSSSSSGYRQVHHGQGPGDCVLHCTTTEERSAMLQGQYREPKAEPTPVTMLRPKTLEQLGINTKQLLSPKPSLPLSAWPGTNVTGVVPTREQAQKILTHYKVWVDQDFKGPPRKGLLVAFEDGGMRIAISIVNWSVLSGQSVAEQETLARLRDLGYSPLASLKLERGGFDDSLIVNQNLQVTDMAELESIAGLSMQGDIPVFQQSERRRNFDF